MTPPRIFLGLRAWVETTQNWEADWLDFEIPALTLRGEMLRVRRDAQQDLLPGNWRLSVFQGTLSIQNADPGRGRTSIQLTERGFRCAHSWQSERYEVSHGPLGGAVREPGFF